MTSLRVLSYNVRSLRDDRDAVTRVIRAAEPDVVCVQEAPRTPRWRTRCADLARRAGLVVVTGGRGAAGNLMLCDLGVEVAHCVDVRYSPAASRRARGAVVAVCRVRGHLFALAGTHLDLDEGGRLRHTRELFARMPKLGVPAELPLIVAGDVNEEPGRPAWNLFTERLTDVATAAGGAENTFPAGSPKRRIDAVFASPGVEVTSCEVPGGPDVSLASDHRPVLAELVLPTH